MKFTSTLLAALASTAVALPTVKRQAPSSANSLADMLKGATGFSPAFLAGDSKGVANALGQMTGGAASFTPGFFNDLGKTAGAKPPTKRQAPAAAGMSTSTSIQDMVNGAAAFSPKVMAGDSQGAATALAQMLGGATSFTPGFFSDLLKAGGSVAASPPTKRQAPAAAGAPLSSSNSLNDMITGATQFSPKFLAGDSQGVATALAQMLGGAASFTPGFFSDLAKGAVPLANAAAGQAARAPTKE
jgi:hypothetical protein